jgi:hypothetical protein
VKEKKKMKRTPPCFSLGQDRWQLQVKTVRKEDFSDSTQSLTGISNADEKVKNF